MRPVESASTKSSSVESDIRPETSVVQQTRERIRNVQRRSITNKDSEDDDIDIILDKRARSLYENSQSIRKSPRINPYTSPEGTKKTTDSAAKTAIQKAQRNKKNKATLVGGKSIQTNRNESFTNKSPSTKSSNKRKRKQPQKRVLNEIMKQQNRTDNLIPKLPFSRLIREILMIHSFNNHRLRITPEALKALQEISEMYLTQIFQDSYLCTIHRNRVTLTVKDMELVIALRKIEIGQ